MELKKGILIIDDHPLFREGLKAIISRSSSFEIFGEAGNWQDGVRMTERLSPDIIIMDISLPGKNGIELTKEICEAHPGINILVVSMHSKVEYIAEALQAGAKGYVTKESASDKLIHALEGVVKDGYYLDSSISLEVIKKLAAPLEKNERDHEGSYASLTPREQEIMRCVVEGLSTKEVAYKLSISPKTVENHRASIMKKLNIHSTVELIRYSAKLGIIDLDYWKK